MAWIESHQELARHPKTRRFARLLGISTPAAIGHLHLFWWWALDYAQDGELSRYDDEDIADACEWDGEAKDLVAAFVEAGFIDEEFDGLVIHDWFDYAGKLMQTREKKNGRKSEMRKAYQDGTIAKVKKRDGDNCRYCDTVVDWSDRKTGKGGTYDHVDPEGPTSVDNLVVACRSCISSKGKRTPEQADMHLLPIKLSNDTSNDSLDTSRDHLTTQHNPTVPNLTIPNQNTSSRSSRHSAHSVFGLYEREIGPLTEITTEILIDLETTYGEEKVKEAIKEAVRQGVKKLSYIEGILQDKPKPVNNRVNTGYRGGGNRRSVRPSVITDDVPDAKVSDAEYERILREMKELEAGRTHGP